MRRRRAGGLVVLLCLGTMWFIVGAPPAEACSCIAPDPAAGDPEAQYQEQADLVIVGRPTAVEHHGQDQLGENEYTFSVEYVHKGAVTTPTALFTADNDGMCGFQMVIGDLYELFPFRQQDGTLHLGICAGNRPATEADLQPYVPPTTAPPPPAPPPTEPPPTSPPPTEAPTTTEAPAETTTSSSSTSSTTASTASTTSTTEPDDEQAIAIADEPDAGGGGGGAGWLLGGGAVGVAAVAGAAFAARRRGLAGAELSPEAAPEP